nr:MAG: hypothetical protein [Bacteriophage sp.]
MIQILRANIVTTVGTIVRDYTEVADELGVYVVEDIEVERQCIADYYTSRGYTVKRINIMYVTK